ALLPHADRARRPLRCAKVRLPSVRARQKPTRLHAHKIAETNRAGELVPAPPPILRQAATGNAHRPSRIAASAAAAVAAPNLPFGNVCEARYQRSVSPARPD